MPISQFGRMCEKLGIELIGANSPQAKGRVERGHGTHQDRLIKKMRLQKLDNYEAANRFLVERYLEQHNARYAVPARESADYHLGVPPRMDLEQVFCLEEERKVSQDWVVQYGRRWLQLEPEQKVRVAAGSTVKVREHRDRSISVWLDRVKLCWHELAERPRKAGVPALPKRRIVQRPAANHPWRQGLPGGAQEARGKSVESNRRGSLQC